MGGAKHSFLVLEPREPEGDLLVLEKNSVGVHLYRQKRYDTILFAVKHSGEQVVRRNVNLFMTFARFETTLQELIKFINDQSLLSYCLVLSNCNDFVKAVSKMLLEGQ